MGIRRVLTVSLGITLLASLAVASIEKDRTRVLIFGPGAAVEKNIPRADAPGSRTGASGSESILKNAASSEVKKDQLGGLWLVWEEWSRSESKIFYGPLEGSRVSSRRAPNQPPGFNYFGDICFDRFNRPYLAWVNVRNSTHAVYVQEVDSGRIWRLDSCLSPSTFSPRTIVDSNNQVWVFWTRRARQQEEIFYSVYDGVRWSPLKTIGTDARFPSLNPAAAVSETGTLRLVWSGYDGRNYEIYSASQRQGLWSKIERISTPEDGANNLFPCVGFAQSEIPVVAWNKGSGKKNAIVLKYCRRGVWSEEEQVSDRVDDFAPPRIDAKGDKLEIAWQNLEGSRGTYSFSGPQRHESRLLAPRPSSEVFAKAAFQENKYTCFGDSITYGYLNHLRFPEKGYVPRLEVLLTESLGETTCYNEGKPGEATSGGLARISAVLADHDSRYLLIMEGTNDVVFNYVSMETAAFNLREMALRCLDDGAFPLLATIIPRRDGFWDNDFYRERMYYLNEQIRFVAADLGIPLVEQFNAFNDYPESDGGCLSLLSEDLKHPSEKGYQLMAQTWFDNLRDLYLPPVNLEASFAFNPNPTYSLSWQPNPQNHDALIKGYNIYKKEAGDSTWQLLLSLPKTATAASFTYAEIRPTIQFGMTTVSNAGFESEMALFSVTYPTLYPATNLRVVVSIKYGGSTAEVAYKLSWQANPQNETKFIQGYRVYKKEGDGEYSPLELLSNSTFAATYAFTNPPQRVQFALATVSIVGTESAPVPFWTQ